MGSGRVARTRQARGFCCNRLSRVQIREQALASRLPGNTHEGNKIIACCARDAAFSHAPVAVAVENPAMVVHRDLVKVEQIAVIVAATLLPNPSLALNGIVRRRVDRHPRLTFIVSRSDERVPLSRETAGLIIARPIGAYKAASRATGTSANRLGVRSVLDSMRRTNIDIANPCLTAVGADFNMNMAFRRVVWRDRLIVYITKISVVIAINGDGRIGAVSLRSAAGDKKFIPCRATIGAHRPALRPSTLVNGQPDSAIWSNMHVSVQPAALRRDAVVSQHTGAITGTQGIAALARCRPYDVLRAIVNSLALVNVVSQSAQGIR